MACIAYRRGGWVIDYRDRLGVRRWQTYQQKPDVFGTVEDLAAHKARIAELEAKRAELHGRFPTTWAHDDLHIGKITSDGAALITFAKAPDEVPVHPPATAGERLIDYVLAAVDRG